MQTRNPSLFQGPAITVGELCRQIGSALESAFPFRVRVKGEISESTAASSGHVYFSLKDAAGLVRCVCFRETRGALATRLPLPDGTAVEVVGRVSTYRPRSQYQLTVEDVSPVGAGELYRRFELLKKKLEAQGLFDESRKRPIPKFVSKIAIVTSRDGDALQDFLKTCRERRAHLQVVLVHAPVQGEAAAHALAFSIRKAGRLPVEVVVVTRGGGSLEDLWAFNTEPVALAIARSPVPVISAVGHERDVTIADFVADRRAATPTAAAEMISADRGKLQDAVLVHERRLARAVGRYVEGLSQRLDDCERGLRAGDPRRRVVELRRRIAAAGLHLKSEFARSLVVKAARCDVAAARLDALGPGATLGRGYAIVFDAAGKTLTDSAQTAVGETLDITLRRGGVRAAVTQTEVPRDESD